MCYQPFKENVISCCSFIKIYVHLCRLWVMHKIKRPVDIYSFRTVDMDGRQWKVVWSFGLSSITPLTPDASCSNCMDSSVRNVKLESSNTPCGTPKKLLRYFVLYRFTYSPSHSVWQKPDTFDITCEITAEVQKKYAKFSHIWKRNLTLVYRYCNT